MEDPRPPALLPNPTSPKNKPPSGDGDPHGRPGSDEPDNAPHPEDNPAQVEKEPV